MNTIRMTTRDAIIEAAFQALRADPTASLGDVAKMAGVGRATLHRHFAARDDLMLVLAETAMAELNQAVDAAIEDATSTADALRRSFAAMVPLAERQWFLANDPIVNHPRLSARYEKDRQALRDAFAAAQAEGAFDPQVSTAWLVETYEALIYAAWTVVRDGHHTPNQAADLAWRTLTAGLSGAPQSQPADTQS